MLPKLYDSSYNGKKNKGFAFDWRLNREVGYEVSHLARKKVADQKL